MEDIVYTDRKVVSCDGGVQGHPKVYLNIEAGGNVVCPYCSKNFIFKVGKAKK